MKYIILTSFLIVFYSISLFSQSSGAAINTTGSAADPSALLDLSSSSQGLLIPRMTEFQKNGIQNPANGLIIYQTDNASGLWIFDGNIWSQTIGTQGPAGATGATGPVSSGTSGQTLRHDGTGWISNSLLFNDGLSIGIGTTIPAQSSVLDIVSNDKGILIPRLTETQRDNIVSPENSLMIFNTTTNCLNIRTGTYWSEICGECTPKMTANAGVDQLGIAGTSTVLSANNPGTASGAWVSLAGGTFTPDHLTYNAAFSGSYGNTYPLVWSVTNHCGTVTDTTYVSFTCNASWPYRQNVTVDNSGNSNTLTDHQVRVTLNHSALVSAGKSSTTGNDILVSDANCQPLHFWIEPSTLNTSSCNIWVKVPQINANSSSATNFNIYYGNMAASTAVNGDSTFVFYDDFDGIANGNPPSSVKWAWTGLTPTVNAGRMRVTNTIAQKAVGPAHVIEGDVICSAPSNNHDFRVNVLISTPNPSLYGTSGYYFYQYLMPWEGGDSRIDRFTSGGAGCSPCLTPCGAGTGGPKYTNYAFRVTTYSPGPSQLQSLEAYNTTNSVTLKSLSCTHQAHGDYFGFSAPTDTRTATVDYIRVRKYANPQPSANASIEIAN